MDLTYKDLKIYSKRSLPPHKKVENTSSHSPQKTDYQLGSLALALPHEPSQPKERGRNQPCSIASSEALKTDLR